MDMPPADPSADDLKAEPSNEDASEQVTGIRLVAMLVSLTLACFLILLDTSIVSTVGSARLLRCSKRYYANGTFLSGDPKDHGRVPFSFRRRLVRKRLSAWKVIQSASQFSSARALTF